MKVPTAQMDPPALRPDLSLVLGGPLYQLWRGARLADDTLRLLHRRVLAMVLVAWAPLLLLSVAEGHACGARVGLSFLHDVELHVRLLIAVPLMILAESIVHQRMRPEVRQFLDRGLIPEAARPTFGAAIDSAIRLRNSVAAEVLLMAFVYVIVSSIASGFSAAHRPTSRWSAPPTSSHWPISATASTW